MLHCVCVFMCVCLYVWYAVYSLGLTVHECMSMCECMCTHMDVYVCKCDVYVMCAQAWTHARSQQCMKQKALQL